MPPSAALPQAVAPPPRTSSAPARASRGTLLQATQPPNGSLSGTPSSSTSERLAPLGPRPRSETPCAVGLALRLSLRRKRLKAGRARRVPSSVVTGVVRSVSAATRVAANGTCSGGSAVRAALTTTFGSATVWALSAAVPARRGHSKRRRRREEGGMSTGTTYHQLEYTVTRANPDVLARWRPARASLDR